MIEGGYNPQRGRHKTASECAKAIEPLLDHLGQDQQLNILAAVETVISELLGFSSEVRRSWSGEQYKHAARGRQEILQDPSIRKEVERFIAENGGTKADLPW